MKPPNVALIVASGERGRIIPVVVLTKLNHHSINDTLLFIKELGAESVMLNRYNIGGKYSRHNLSLSKDEIHSAFDIALKHDLKITSNVCSPMCYINPERYPNIKFGHCKSDFSKRPITVTADGDVRLCNHSPVIVGNIFKNSFEEMFNTEYALSWDFIKPTYCMSCNKYEICRGGCRAASEQLGLTLHDVDPVVYV